MKKTMKKSNKHTPSPAKNYLYEITQTLKPVCQLTGMSVNEAIVDGYIKQTNNADWLTFNEWKKRGFYVQKNEAGFPVWSRPVKHSLDLTTGETSVVDENDNKNEKNTFNRFYVSYLFNSQQVADKNGMNADGDKYQYTGLVPPHMAQTPVQPVQPQAQPIQMALAI